MHTIILVAFTWVEAPSLLEEVKDKTRRWSVENGTSNQQHRASNRRQQGIEQ